MRIRGRLAVGVAVAAMAIVAMACASSGDLEATQQDLVQTKSDLAAATQRLSDLEGRLTTAQASLESADNALDASVASLSDGQAELKTRAASVGADLSSADERLTGLIADVTTDLADARRDVRTNKSAIAEREKGLAAAKSDLDAVSAQSDDLKASFLLTRDDVGANKATIEALGTRSAGAERVALVAHLFHLWGQVETGSAEEGTLKEALRQATIDTGDPAIMASWVDLTAALDSANDDPTNGNVGGFLGSWNGFLALLGRSLSDTLETPAE